MEENRNIFKKAGEGAAGRAAGVADFFAESLGEDRYGAERAYVSLDDALRNAREYVRPADDHDTEDRRQSRKSSYSRDLNKNIVKNRERREAGNTRLSDADRDARIDYYIREFERQMDVRGCDGLQFLCPGYDIRLVREPEEGAAITMSMNGKKVFVHPDLKGEEVFITASRAEISRDLATREDAGSAGGCGMKRMNISKRRGNPCGREQRKTELYLNVGSMSG